METSTKELLIAIAKEFNTTDERKTHPLWNILSALRGPDMGLDMPGSNTTYTSDKTSFKIPITADSVKAATTAVIRMALLQRDEETFSDDGYLSHVFVLHDSMRSCAIRVWINMNPYAAHSLFGLHFIMHARCAFAAMGLKWNEVNSV